MKRIIVACLLMITAVIPASARDTNSIPVAGWQRVPVQYNGRVMPMDSLARNLLLSISGRSTFERKPASAWLARVFFSPDATLNDKIFLINNPEVLEALGLEAKGRGRFSYSQLEPALPELSRLARAAFHLDAKQREPVDVELIRLFNNVNLFGGLLKSFDFAATSEDAGMFRRGHGDNMPAIFPVPSNADEPWLSPGAIGIRGTGGEFAKEIDTLKSMAASFRDGRLSTFDKSAGELAALIGSRMASEKQARRIGMEVSFNLADPFYRSEILYGFAFLAAMISVPIRKRWLYFLAAALTATALVPHTYGIVARMFIMGRPPVTNLYTTFIFVAWTSTLLGLVMEYIQRNRLGLIVAAASGLALLLTAGRFNDGEDTMGVMVAVLDSNFWLATHVVTISMGYAGCCAAGLLGHIYLLQAFRRDPSDTTLLETYRAVFGLQAFGLIFSFVGTMLGGVWADQSWGRFWGWDPKENGALVIVLWSATLFHARACGLIANRGFAAGSVLGVIAVMLAWMGVNLLGVGLHSYGFTSGIARGLMIACGLEVLFVAATVPFARSPKTADAIKT